MGGPNWPFLLPRAAPDSLARPADAATGDFRT